MRRFANEAPHLRVAKAVVVAMAIALPGEIVPQTPQCTPAPRGDGAPWIWNSRVLRSFPPDNPQPKFLGAFGDRQRQYELHLWRTADGIFGEVLSPVLEADSPTSRLYDARLDPRTGAISFATHFPARPWSFTGTLGPRIVSGTVVSGTGREPVVLRKVRESAPPVEVLEGAYTSRAQFECAAILFHRY